MQLELFEKDEVKLLEGELKLVKLSCDKLRKALFARHGELAKNYMDLLQRMDVIEHNICNHTTRLF